MSYNQVFEADLVRDFDPDQIFDCGQCFRWEKSEEGYWEGIVGCGSKSRHARLSYEPDCGRLIIDEDRSKGSAADAAEDRAFWTNYFDLDRDYGKIKAQLTDGDEVMAKAIEFGSGIRILRQDSWETIVSFIISQNNNIPRIKKCIKSLAELCGGRSGGIPDSKTLAAMQPEDLDICRLGYRARYLVETAHQVEELGMPEDYEGLRSICGAGPKVASCIDLFGLGNLDSFPIDVWMKRVMNQLYGIAENDAKAMGEYAAAHFAPYGGIAQQYLFYYITHK
ncbi:MAG: DNA glycosylase [Bacillota bacterium]|nr:DNA glycosylase [Bacillota bacterium]